jgi:predicted nucleotidyltransferase
MESPMADPNLHLLIDAASLLSPLLDELVFVGGSITGLLITDPGAVQIRPTEDVDAITEITTYAEYTDLSRRLRELGFKEDTSNDAPLCRFRNGSTILDVMPLSEDILGFSNHWYKAAIDNATEHKLENGERIRVATAPYFCATKIEAFRGRGGGDYLASHDLEDFVAIVDGRAELLDDLQQAYDDVRSYISSFVSLLIQNDQFINALPGYLPSDEASQSRVSIVIEILSKIAALE